MSNHIEHIEITNFKSIRHQKIEGCKRINVFIGYPNVGKSAILEAIAALSYLQKDYKEDYSKLCRLNYTYELFHDSIVKRPIEIKVNNDNLLTFKYVSEINLEFKVSSTGGLLDGIMRSVKEINFERGKERGLSSSYNGTEIINLNVKKYVFANQYNEHKTNGLILANPYGENLADIVHLNKEVRKEVSDLFQPYGLKLLIDPATNSIRGLKQLDDETIFTVPFYQMADTLQRLIFHKAAIMSNENTVLLFEEPEAHMFPPYIRMFTKDIVFDKGRNNQYFIATHSPVVLSDFLEDAREELTIHLVGYKNGETIVKTLTDKEVNEVYEYGVDLFFNIESYLD